ncbi:MAG: hypothetical protein K8R77_02465 [Anaerolineaceae bacterium]|nr:hypothetical protein [Anaerolineaceae bacterium]
MIQQKVEDALSDALLSHEFMDGDTILVDVDEDGQIVLSKDDNGEKTPEEALGVGV